MKEGVQNVGGKVAEILGELTSKTNLTKMNIANCNHFVSHQKLDLFILLLNQLYQRIGIIWQIVEKAKVSQ